MHDRIKKLRKALDLTQQEFASRIGTTANVLTNYETGRRNPSASVINNICKTFSVNEAWLRNGTGEMFAESDTFSLDAYAASHGCTDLDIAFLKTFFDLDPDMRNRVLDHFRKSLAKRQPPAAPTDAEARMAAMEKRIEDLEKEEEPAPAPAPVPAQSSSRSH